MLHVVSPCTTRRIALNSLPSQPSLRGVIARESLRFDQSTVSSRKTQNWNCLIMRFFALFRMTRPRSKRRVSTKNAPFCLIFHLILRDPSRQLESLFGKKSLKIASLPQNPLRKGISLFSPFKTLNCGKMCRWLRLFVLSRTFFRLSVCPSGNFS